MLNRAVRRCYSSRPILQEVLPSKKILSRLLFDNNARYNINKYMPIITSIYNTSSVSETPGEPSIPTKCEGNDLMIFQRVLAQIRKQTHTINPHLVQLENDIIEIAAERGSRDALTTLSFMALDDTKSEFRNEDKEAAKKFLKQLIELEHPLVFKMAADRELSGIAFMSQGNHSPLLPTDDIPMNELTTSSKHISRAISLYEHFLKLDTKSTLSAAAHRSLGMIYFRLQDLTKSDYHFEQAVQLAPLSENAQAHFFLGLLNENDSLLSRYHFQLAAGEGFRESFASLGYLELNVFKDAQKAIEWFKLGAELNVGECIVGLFDGNNVLGEHSEMTKVVERAEKLGFGPLLRKVRKDQVAKVLRERDLAKQKEWKRLQV